MDLHGVFFTTSSVCVCVETWRDTCVICVCMCVNVEAMEGYICAMRVCERVLKLWRDTCVLYAYVCMCILKPWGYTCVFSVCVETMEGYMCACKNRLQSQED